MDLLSIQIQIVATSAKNLFLRPTLCVYRSKRSTQWPPPPCTPPLFAKNMVKYTKKNGHFWPFFDLFLTSNRVPILLSKKLIPQTHVQLTPCHNLSPLRPSRPILLSANPQPLSSLPRQLRCHQHRPSLPTTAVANNRRCQRPLQQWGNDHYTANDRNPPNHHMSFIPMAQPPTWSLP